MAIIGTARIDGLSCKPSDGEVGQGAAALEGGNSKCSALAGLVHWDE